jgi:outer membrane protein assembly factor BamB
VVFFAFVFLFFWQDDVEAGGVVCGKDWDMVYIGSTDDNVYAIHADTGALGWSYTTQGSVRSAPACSLDGSVVYVPSDDNSLYALDAGGGKVVLRTVPGGPDACSATSTVSVTLPPSHQPCVGHDVDTWP